MMHRPESVRSSYREEPSFNVLYQSPLANVSGALAGLLLAHIHHMLLDNDINLNSRKVSKLFYNVCKFSIFTYYKCEFAFVFKI